MLAAIQGVLASRSARPIGDNSFRPGDSTILDIRVGPPPNNSFYAEVLNQDVISLGPPQNALFYTETSDQQLDINISAPANTLFYTENIDGTPVILLAASDFITIYTEVDSNPLPLLFGNEVISFFPGEDSMSAVIPIQLAPRGEETLFFSANDANRVIPLAFGR